MLLILGIILVLVGFWILGRKMESNCLIAFSTTGLIFLPMMWILCYCGSLGTIADLEAFLGATKSSYEFAIKATEDVEIKGITEMVEKTSGQSIEVDLKGLAYEQQGKVTSERIKEFRDRIEWYNSTLREFERYNDFWLTDGFYADLPPDLVPIVIE